MEINFDTTLVAVCISVPSSMIASAIFTRSQNRTQERLFIESSIKEILQIAIQYPWLEDDNYCARYEYNEEYDEKLLQYISYCCMVFNLLQTIWKFCKKNNNKIGTIINAQELAVRHKKWWLEDPENRSAYNQDFKDYIALLIS